MAVIETIMIIVCWLLAAFITLAVAVTITVLYIQWSARRSFKAWLEGPTDSKDVGKVIGKFCSKECEETGPLCDFCHHYEFDKDKRGRYTGKGWCRLHKKRCEPGSSCEDFECFQYQAVEGVKGEGQ